MSESDIRTLLTNQRKIAFWASMGQLAFTLLLLAVVLWVRSRDIDELRHAIDEARCQCDKHLGKPTAIHNENHINTESALDRIYNKLLERGRHDVRGTLRTISTGDVSKDGSRSGAGCDATATE